MTLGATAQSLDRESIERGRRLFAAQCNFIAGAADPASLPVPALPEIAFAGRSNVGKSSLLNALTGRKTLARSSRTPGRTQQINFFDLGGRLMLVDLPGYGYARAPRAKIGGWGRLVRLYLARRPKLVRTLVLIDARHGLKESDRGIFLLLDRAAVSYQVVLTKIDLVAAADLVTRTAEIAAELARHPAAYPALAATSAATGGGIPELRAMLATLAGLG